MRNRNRNTVPPQDKSYKEWLRYMVQSSDPQAGELPFLVGCYNHILRTEDLTVDQMRALGPYIEEASIWLHTTIWKSKLQKDDMTNVVSLFDREESRNGSE